MNLGEVKLSHIGVFKKSGYVKPNHIQFRTKLKKPDLKNRLYHKSTFLVNHILDIQIIKSGLKYG